ncbi:MAG: hypothetical protein KC591_15500, partial [Gemmatimonadetes bacterium]|nr:hypothetical protein [Gemmatimonadota bacterium]
PLGNGLVTNTLSRTGRAAAFDPDGPGPSPTLLYVHGATISWAGEVQPAGGDVVAWDGNTWIDPAFSTDDRITRIEALDLGGGPELYVAGEFSQIGGIPANHIAKWDGVTWSALGSGINVGYFLDFQTWDPDGPGPSPAVLVVAGESLTLAGGVPVDRVAQWDGSAWSDLGGGVFGYYGVTGLGTYDEDGDGTASLFAVKNTGITNGVCDYDDWLFRLDGPGWSSFGTGYGFYLADLETYDPDGAGPADEQLYMPLQFHCTLVEDPPGQALARWNGSTFQDLGFPHSSEPGPLAVVDLDGDGPGYESLFATNVTGAGEIAGFDGTSWTVVGRGVGSFTELSEYDPDGTGPRTPQLVALGGFSSLRDEATGDVFSSGGIGIYGHEGIVTSAPVHLPAAPGSAPALTVGRVQPTPSRDLARVVFGLQREAVVQANVFDVQGRRVRRLLDERFPAGSHVVFWDGTEDGGRRAGSGVYFLRLEAHGESVTRRIVRIE